MRGLALLTALLSLPLAIIHAPSARASSLAIASPAYSMVIGPLLLRQYTGRAEMNLNNEASMIVEGSYALPGEALFNEELTQNPGESFMVDGGHEMSLLIARYSEPVTLSGFYWVLGGGWREMRATWKRPINDQTADYTLTETTEVDGDNRFTTQQEFIGGTLHGRLGYRYIASFMPVIIGGQLGLRHFNPKIQDIGDETTLPPDESDARLLRRRVITSGSLELTLGVML
jgi:hypothetical protein